MLLGRGLAPQSLGCGSTAPTPGPRFLFSTPISVCVCIILEIHYPTAAMTPWPGWPQESKSVREDKDGCFPLFFFAYMRSNEHPNAAVSWQARLMICHCEVPAHSRYSKIYLGTTHAGKEVGTLWWCLGH